MTYLDVWRSGTFLLHSCKAAFWTQESLPRLSDVKCSVVLQSVFVIGSALIVFPGMCHSSTHPGMSLHVISFTRPFPALVLQVTNAGVRRPGYEANKALLLCWSVCGVVYVVWCMWCGVWCGMCVRVCVCMCMCVCVCVCVCVLYNLPIAPSLSISLEWWPWRPPSGAHTDPPGQPHPLPAAPAHPPSPPGNRVETVNSTD